MSHPLYPHPDHSHHLQLLFEIIIWNNTNVTKAILEPDVRPVLCQGQNDYIWYRWRQVIDSSRLQDLVWIHCPGHVVSARLRTSGYVNFENSSSGNNHNGQERPHKDHIQTSEQLKLCFHVSPKK